MDYQEYCENHGKKYIDGVLETYVESPAYKNTVKSLQAGGRSSVRAHDIALALDNYFMPKGVWMGTMTTADELPLLGRSSLTKSARACKYWHGITWGELAPFVRDIHLPELRRALKRIYEMHGIDLTTCVKPFQMSPVDMTAPLYHACLAAHITCYDELVHMGGVPIKDDTASLTARNLRLVRDRTGVVVYTCDGHFFTATYPEGHRDVLPTEEEVMAFINKNFGSLESLLQQLDTGDKVHIPFVTKPFVQELMCLLHNHRDGITLYWSIEDGLNLKVVTV